MLVHSEEYLGNVRFRVNLELLLHVSLLARQGYDASDDVLDHVGLRGNGNAEVEVDLVAGFFLFFEFCVDVEEQVFGWSLLTGFFSLEAVYSYGDGYARNGVFRADV